MPPSILDEIKAYNSQIVAGECRCNFASCPKCGETPECFKLHEIRSRSFRVVQERSVLKVGSFVCRWKCPVCKQTSIDYPSFALPYKRYVKATILDCGAKYVHEDNVSYRQVACSNEGLPTCYESADLQDVDERQFRPSTVHRWITGLSGLCRTLRTAFQLIRQTSPTCGAFRRILAVPIWKYRSDKRRKQLGTCHRLLLAEVEFRGLFDSSLFPRFATANAWG